jgi:hypothetical protein
MSLLLTKAINDLNVRSKVNSGKVDSAEDEHSRTYTEDIESANCVLIVDCLSSSSCRKSGR